MKTHTASIITTTVAFALFSSASFATGTDSAEELAMLLYNRTQFEAEIHKAYQDMASEPSKAAAVREAVDEYLKTEFPWKDLQTACIGAIRATFTPAEQVQLLVFLRTPVGDKFRRLTKAPAFNAASDLLARESSKMFHAIEVAVDGASSDVKPGQQSREEVPRQP